MTKEQDPYAPQLRNLIATAINSFPKTRQYLQKKYGCDNVWSMEEFAKDFILLKIVEPCVAVRRRSDGQTGVLMFQQKPRFYFDFQPADFNPKETP